MARDVNEILVNICEKQGQMGRTQATQYVKDLGQKSRYVQDVWSWSGRQIKSKTFTSFFDFLNTFYQISFSLFIYFMI